MKECTLPEDINTCPYFIESNNTCKNSDMCSYQYTEKKVIKSKEKWYEKYYKKSI